MNKSVKSAFNILWYVIVFLVIQVIFQYAAVVIDCLQNGGGFNLTQLSKSAYAVGTNGRWLTVVTVLSSALTVLLFSRFKWAVLSNAYIKSHPWTVLAWVVLLAVGTILPSEWLDEKMQLALPKVYEQLFESILKEPWGYLAVGLLAPLAEEVVFRGAVLRSLLHTFGDKYHWIAIAASALLFGLIHFNLAQGIHAFIIGLLLGWLYYRTGSIIPGVVLHWVNNTIAYVMFNLMPQMADGKLIDLFHGDRHLMLEGLLCSLFILIPSIFQLAIKMKKVK